MENKLFSFQTSPLGSLLKESNIKELGSNLDLDLTSYEFRKNISKDLNSPHLISEIPFLPSTEKEVISEGAFGIVYKVKIGDNYYAYKEFKPLTSKSRQISKDRELLIVRTLSSSYLLPALPLQNNSGMIMPLGISMFGQWKYLFTSTNHPNIIDLSDLKTIVKQFHQIASGIEYLNSKGYIHMDIKFGNVILMPTEYRSSQIFNQDSITRNTRLIDFGSALTLSETIKFSKELLHPSKKYASPEYHLRKDGISFSHDVWSLGIMLYTILYGHHPLTYLQPKSRSRDFIFYEQYSYQPPSFMILNNETISYDETLPLKWYRGNETSVSFGSDLVNLLKSMLSFNPANRCSITTVKNQLANITLRFFFNDNSMTDNTNKVDGFEKFMRVYRDNIKEISTKTIY